MGYKDGIIRCNSLDPYFNFDETVRVIANSAISPTLILAQKRFNVLRKKLPPKTYEIKVSGI